MEALAGTPRESFLAIAIAAMVGCALISFFIAGRATARAHVALALLVALIGSFSLFAILAPLAKENPFIGALIILALIGLFKLMNQFEILRRPDRPGN